MSREEQRARTQRDALAGHRPTTGVVLAVIAAVLLAACGGVNEQRVGDDNLRFFVHGRTAGGSAGMAAEVVGVLTAADGCVLLEQDGTRYPVVWPSGTSVADADPLTIELPSGAELEPTVRTWDVIGIVTAVEFGEGYRASHVPGSEEPFEPGARLGPLTVTLSDGRQLTVPVDTAGDNGCPELLTDPERLEVTGLDPPAGLDADQVRRWGLFSDQCVIIGQTAGEVLEQFVVLRMEPGRGVVVGEPVSTHDGGLLTSSGYVFPVSTSLTIECLSDADDLDDVLNWDGEAATFVGPSTGEVAVIECLYVD